jgi:hypothetical protein
VKQSVSYQSLYKAWQICRKGKNAGKQAQMCKSNLIKILYNTQQALQTGYYQPVAMRGFMANNAVKPREIPAPHFKEPKFIYDGATNIKNKGTYFVLRRLQKNMRQLQVTHSTAYVTSNTPFVILNEGERSRLPLNTSRNTYNQWFKKYLISLLYPLPLLKVLFFYLSKANTKTDKLPIYSRAKLFKRGVKNHVLRELFINKNQIKQQWS